MEANHIRIGSDDMKSILKEKLLALNFQENKADTLARIITESSLDGVYSHGIYRFLRFIEYVKKGFVNKDGEPSKINGYGALEQWDGNSGPGILNAVFSMQRAMVIADGSGIGCVGLRNTNHWLRGGTYGWQAAEAGYIGVCFTNTKPNMLPWGGAEPRIGNNPFIIAIPGKEGHIVLDMAVSQYSFGKMEQYAHKKTRLPFPGGFDTEGNLTTDPLPIIENEYALPIGYWKGSALSMMLDMLAAIISGGDPSCRIGNREEEYGLSQVFIALHPIFYKDYIGDLTSEVIHFTKQVRSFHVDDHVYYPGEKTVMKRKENSKNGIPVDPEYWESILKL